MKQYIVPALLSAHIAVLAWLSLSIMSLNSTQAVMYERLGSITLVVTALQTDQAALMREALTVHAQIPGMINQATAELRKELLHGKAK